MTIGVRAPQNPAYTPEIPTFSSFKRICKYLQMRSSHFVMRRAFTLIEILIVLAIIGILAALILPVFERTRRLARRTSCTSQLKQIGLATHLYRGDFDEIPPHLSLLHPTYTNDAQIFVCPSDAQKAQYNGSDFVEGRKYLASGVSYEYFAQWELARLAGLGWYQAPPNFGPGKWEDLTPYVGCAWHWATSFDADAPANAAGIGGWQLILTLGGSVRKVRAEAPMSHFSPAKYQ